MTEHDGRAGATPPPAPAPTTRAQVSGHRFLTRRLRHGLVFGDIRMLHDPLARRRRAVIFGLVSAALLAAGAGLLAVVDPAPEPGEAAIVRARQTGALFVRVDGRLHPVGELTSARLVAGEPADPQAADSAWIRGQPLGAPVGLDSAPGTLAQKPPQPGLDWAACTEPDGSVTVDFAPPAAGLSAGEAVLATPATADTADTAAADTADDDTAADANGRPRGEWLLTAAGRSALPEASTPEGRAVRRGLGVTGATPVWRPPVDVLAAVPERPAVRVPEPLPELLDDGSALWARSGGAVAPVGPAGADILAQLGAPRHTATAAEIAGLADAAPVDLPDTAPRFIDPAGSRVCTGAPGAAVSVAAGRADAASESGKQQAGPQQVLPRRRAAGEASRRPAPIAEVDLAGAFLAERYRGPAAGAFSVDTGHGVQVVSDHGVRHRLTDPRSAEVLGLPEPVAAPWAVLRLLPEGAALDGEKARRTRPAAGP